jgi:hypothetical protein
MILSANGDYFPKQNYVIHLCNVVCCLCAVRWISKYYSEAGSHTDDYDDYGLLGCNTM